MVSNRLVKFIINSRIMTTEEQIELLEKYIEVLKALIFDHYETGQIGELDWAEQQLKILNISNEPQN